MKSFKSFLAESSLSSVNVLHMETEDLVQCYINAGYKVSREEMKDFRRSKHIGYVHGDRRHLFAMLWYDDNEDQYAISKYFVELGEDGKIHAEPAHGPEHEGTEEEMDKIFDNL